MIGKLVRGLLLGLLVCLTVGVWPAFADVTNVKVTGPAQNQVLTGSYDTDGTPTGFLTTLAGSAYTSCGEGWTAIKFTVTGPSPAQTFNVAAPATGGTWGGSPTTKWNTQPLKNGIYTVRLDVTEKDTLALACKGQAGSGYITAKLANRAATPAWVAAPAAAANGAASVTLKFTKAAETDVVEYLIVRDGPGGQAVAPVSAASPDDQGCTVSGSTITCHDTTFPASYDGQYTYKVFTLRSRPAYNTGETQLMCSTVATPCVSSAASDEQAVVLTAPTPTPTPSPTDSPSSTPTPGGTPTGGGPGTPGSTPGTTGGGGGLSFGGYSGGSHRSDFFTGTYEKSLPYAPRTLLLPPRNSSSPEAQGFEGQIVAETAPDYRTVMLPVAGGLLAFLSAAHVRRLLIHL